GDFDGDGKADVFSIGADSGGRVGLSLGDGRFLWQPQAFCGNGPGVPVLGDFNADGRLDALADGYGCAPSRCQSQLELFNGLGDGDFGCVGYPPGTRAYSNWEPPDVKLARADFNSDGTDDVALVG